MPRCLPSSPNVFAPPDQRGLPAPAQRLSAPYSWNFGSDGVSKTQQRNSGPHSPNFQALLQQLSLEHERVLNKLRNENTQLHRENKRLLDSLGSSTADEDNGLRPMDSDRITMSVTFSQRLDTYPLHNSEGSERTSGLNSKLSPMRQMGPSAGLDNGEISAAASNFGLSGVPSNFVSEMSVSKEDKVLLCPSGHPVEKGKSPSDWACGLCFRRGSPAEARYRCDLCNFHICPECFDKDVTRDQGSVVRCSMQKPSRRSQEAQIEDKVDKMEVVHDAPEEEEEEEDEIDDEALEREARFSSSMLFFEVDELWKNQPSGFVVNKIDSMDSDESHPKLAHLPQAGSSMSLQMLTSWQIIRQKMRYRWRSRQLNKANIYELLEFFISYPSSMHRVMWDITGTLLITYDVIVLPLKLFDFAENNFTNAMDWITLVFWTSDILASFLVGYIDKGLTVMDPKKIALHYLRTWFIVDTIIVLVDWVFKVARESDSGAGIGRVLRFLRVARTIRLIRLFKLKRIYVAIQDHIESDVASIAVDIAKLILSVLMLAHFISCIWYHLGANPSSTGGGWIYQWNEDDKPHLYTISLEWALTKLLLESIEVHPLNIEERTCSICVAIFGMIVFTSVVSKLTSSMVSLQSMRGDSSRQFWLLRRYFKERGVPKELATRIQRFLEHACSEQEHHVQEANIPILQLLSVQLSDELRYQFHNQELSIHPLFCHISWTSDITMHRLSKLAISRVRLARNDWLIHAGEVAHHMYIPVSGSMSYKNIRMADHRPQEISVSKGDWICEPCLWVLWIHLGKLSATTECEILLLDAKIFRQVIRTNLHIWQIIALYAERYCHRLNTQLDSLTDVVNSTKEYWTLSKFIDNFDTNAGLRNWRLIAIYSKTLKRGNSVRI